MRRLFILRKDILKDYPGKAIAMASHCAEAYWTNWLRKNTDSDGLVHGLIDMDILDNYINNSFVKTICEARNLNHLKKAEQIAENFGLVKGVDFDYINDNCYTVLTPENEDGTTTVGIWFKPLADDISHQISKKYQLYK